MGSFWTWVKIASLMLAVLVIVPVVWLIAAHSFGTPAVVSGEGGGLVATIGGVMGTIFTVGGLVIALVAILTQLSVEDRVRKAVTDAKSDLETKYEQELRPELVNRAKLQVQAEIAYFRATATDISDWRTAEQLTREALEKDPNLAGARSFLALRLSSYVIGRFWAQHSQSPGLGNWPPLTTAVHLDLDSPTGRVTYTPTVVNLPYIPPAELPVLEAIHWLQESLTHGETEGGRAAADLALMYAIEGRHDKMIEAIGQARALNIEVVGQARILSTEQGDYLTQPYQLWVLASACGNNESHLRTLGEALDISLPASHEAVVASVEQYQPDPSRNPTVAWYVMPRPVMPEPAHPITFPVRLLLFIDIDKNDARKIIARYFGPAKPGAYGPEDIPPPGDLGMVPWQPVQDWVKHLEQRFLFICETSPQ